MKHAAKRKPVVKILPKIKFSFLFIIFILLVITGLIVYLVISSSPSERPKAATTLTPSVDQLIATRGDNLLQHDISLPNPVNYYDWGQHGKEWAKSLYPDSHCALAYTIVYPDVSQATSGIGAVRYNIRRIALWNYQGGKWVKVADGLPGWFSALNFALTSWTDVSKTVEPDGSYSFPVPNGLMFHAAGVDCPTLMESGGTIAVIESRLLGTPAAIAAAVVGDAAGVDYRGSAGAAFGTGYHAASSGHFQRLTGEWKTNVSLATAMTDAQVRANPPLGFTTTTPTPTPITSPLPVVTCTQVDYDHDGKISILDLAKMAKSDRAKVGDPKYNVIYDLNKDGVINTLDYSIAATFFTKKC